MGRYAAIDAPGIDRIVDEAIAGVAAEVAALAIPRLAGIVLGGGYGRGEGGVIFSGGGARLSNDLDFYVVTEDGASADDIARIGEALRPVSEKWTAQLGVDVDFCTAKTPWRLKHDEARLMIQELIHGYVDVAGKKGEELFAHIRRLSPSELPWSEAVRLMMNRGAGLLLAKEKIDRGHAPEDRNFIDRNINKAILGAGDARLIAEGRYAWKIQDRAAALADGLYAKAVEWKLQPAPESVCGWDAARSVWMDAFEQTCAAPRGEGARSLFHALRWLARRKTFGEAKTFGLMPEQRVAYAIRNAIADRAPFADSLKKDWIAFN